MPRRLVNETARGSYRFAPAAFALFLLGEVFGCWATPTPPDPSTVTVILDVKLVGTTGTWDFMWVAHPQKTPRDGGSWE